MIIFWNSIKRILRSKAQLVIMLVIPLLPIIPISMGDASGGAAIVLGVADEDRTQLTAELTDSLEKNCDVVRIKKSDIENQLLNYKIHYAIVISKGFTESVIHSGDEKITGYANKDIDLSDPIRSYIKAFMDPVKSIAAASGGNEETFRKGMEFFRAGAVTTGGEMLAVPNKYTAVAAWGMIIQFMMFSSVFAATILITDKENRTFFRTLTAPVSMRSYMFQSILSLAAVTVLQILVLVSATAFIFGVYPGPSFLSLLLLFLVFSFISVSFGIVIGSYSRNTVQASVIGAGLVVLMCVTGGAWGATAASGAVKNLSRLMPVSWAMDCIQKLLDNGQLIPVASNIMILLLFSVVFFLIGTWRKVDIAK